MSFLNSWLKRGKHGAAPRPMRDVEAYMPASVQAPESQRFNVYTPGDEEEGPDEDLEFLSTLVREIDRNPQAIESKPAEPRRRTPPVAEDDPHAIPSAVQRDDRALQIFRENADWEERRELPAVMRVGDIDLADLVETLSTTAAALRQRKAA